MYIYPPFHIITWIGSREAGVYMPPGIASREIARKPNWKRAQCFPAQPIAFASKLVKSSMQHTCVGSLLERFHSKFSDANYGLCPGSWIVRIATGNFP